MDLVKDRVSYMIVLETIYFLVRHPLRCSRWVRNETRDRYRWETIKRSATRLKVEDWTYKYPRRPGRGRLTKEGSLWSQIKGSPHGWWKWSWVVRYRRTRRDGRNRDNPKRNWSEWTLLFTGSRYPIRFSRQSDTKRRNDSEVFCCVVKCRREPSVGLNLRPGVSRCGVRFSSGLPEYYFLKCVSLEDPYPVRKIRKGPVYWHRGSLPIHR